jgi:energy-coupling factor transporter transmembrane protein EcfT
MAIFLVPNTYFLLLFFAIQLILLFVKKINITSALYSLLKMSPIILLTFIFNCIFDNFINAIFIAIKLSLVCNITFIYKETFGTIKIIEAISNIFSPLKIIGISSKDISLIINIAITFIPNFLSEYKQLNLSLKQKGAKSYSFSNLKTTSKLLLISAFKKTQALELTLKSKAYTED